MSEKRGLSQEALKIIACVTMLIDHFGAILCPSLKILRIIGRIAFPVYCFLLVEGSHYTRNPKKYGLRLLISAILSEGIYDLVLYGGWTWEHNNVMITLLLGFMAIQVVHWDALKTVGSKAGNAFKFIIVMALVVAAELFHSDYGFIGVLLILMFDATREWNLRPLVQVIGMFWLFSAMGGTQIWGFLSIIPIALYSGKKTCKSKALQWGFYLFYPVHLLWLYVLPRCTWRVSIL